MNMKMNLKLDFKPEALLRLLSKAAPAIAGLLLIGIFGYTGWVLNQAFNAQPAPVTTAPTSVKVSFDKNTIKALQKLQIIPGQVTPTAIGTSNPFGQ